MRETGGARRPAPELKDSGMPSSFGKMAKEARLKAQVSKADLSLVTGLCRTYITDIEEGRRQPPAERHLEKWARKIGLETESFRTAAFHGKRRIVLEMENAGMAEREFMFALVRKRAALKSEVFKKLLAVLEE